MRTLRAYFMYGWFVKSGYCMAQSLWGQKKTFGSQFFPSTVGSWWLSLSGLATSTFTSWIISLAHEATKLEEKILKIVRIVQTKNWRTEGWDELSRLNFNTDPYPET